MEQQTLYRKYRPIDFETVVGQEHIVRTLKNQIKNGKIAHAYLFSGTRGTGKTTVAKIFARTINCLNVKDGNPCNECEVCKSSLEGNDININEMDAASNRSVEAVRRIGEEIQYPPLKGEKYKVYIIDEAHALTREATQSFLKILEEPPEYVIYILATTDPNMLPETILSRCQKYNFKRITIETMVEYIKTICAKENINIDDEALYYIAEKSDGSMREALSMLDRCRGYAVNENIDKNIILEILGIVSNEDFSYLTNAIVASDVRGAFNLISNIIEKGKDIVQFTQDYIWYLRNLMMTKCLTEPDENLGITKNNFAKLKNDAEKISRETLIYYINSFSQIASIMKYDDNKRVILETEILRLMTPSSTENQSAIIARISNLETKLDNFSYDIVNVSKYQSEAETDGVSNVGEKKIAAESKATPNKTPQKKVIEVEKGTYDDMQNIIKNWDTIVSEFQPVTRTYLKKAIIKISEDQNNIDVIIKDDVYNKLGKIEEEVIQKIKNKVKQYIKKDIDFNLILDNNNTVNDDIEYRIIDDLNDRLSKIDDKIDMEIEDIQNADISSNEV